MFGCGHMTTTGQWIMTPCDAKLEAAICQISGMCVNTITVYNSLHVALNRKPLHLAFIFPHSITSFS